jgi:hypothetical protein
MSNFKEMFNSYSNPADFKLTLNPKDFQVFETENFSHTKCVGRRKVPNANTNEHQQRNRALVLVI